MHDCMCIAFHCCNRCCTIRVVFMHARCMPYAHSRSISCSIMCRVMYTFIIICHVRSTHIMHTCMPRAYICMHALVRQHVTIVCMAAASRGLRTAILYDVTVAMHRACLKARYLSVSIIMACMTMRTARHRALGICPRTS